MLSLTCCHILFIVPNFISRTLTPSEVYSETFGMIRDLDWGTDMDPTYLLALIGTETFSIYAKSFEYAIGVRSKVYGSTKLGLEATLFIDLGGGQCLRQC